MNRALLILSLAALSACTAPQNPRDTNEVLPSSTAVYPSPDGRLYTTIRHAKEPCTVAIVERATGKVLGVARSSARLQVGSDQMFGEVKVTYADDLSTIVVHEEFSDASPNPRYILFQRRAGSTGYRASYLAPPTAPSSQPGEFDFICPAIRQVTSDTITLDYYRPGTTRVLRISDLLQTDVPRSSQEWPSEAYKRYESNP